MRYAAAAVLLISLSCSDKQSSINYLDQPDPGDKATLFAPGTISTDAIEHSAPAFAPDGSVVLWTVLDDAFHASMMEMTFKDGTWSAPHLTSFADSTSDHYYPMFSTDGSKLYFSSRRAMPEGYPPTGDMRIWEVPRMNGSWGKPMPIDTTVSRGHEYGYSVSENGSVYFVSSDNWDIAFAKKTSNGFEATQMMPAYINSKEYEDGPCIAPDESYIIYETKRPDGVENSIDLYISFKNNDGQWSGPINMGDKINTKYTERMARVSPDGKYLFFASSRLESETKIGFDIFWINVSIIDELKKNIKP